MLKYPLTNNVIIFNTIEECKNHQKSIKNKYDGTVIFDLNTLKSLEDTYA